MNYFLVFTFIFVLLIILPVFSILRFCYHLIQTLSSHRNLPTVNGSKFTFFEIFKPNGTKRLLNALVDKDGKLKGKIFYLGSHIDGKKTIGITDAEEFRELLNIEKFAKLEIVYDAFDLLLGNGLVLSKGDLWKRQRRLLTPVFHFKNLSKMPEFMTLRIQNLCNHLSSQSSSSSPSSIVNASKLFSKLTLEIVIDCIFGGSEYLDAEIMSPMWRSINIAANNYFLSSIFFGKKVNSCIPFPWNLAIKRQISKIKTMIKRAIEMKKEILKNASSNEPLHFDDDLLSSLLLVRDETTGESIDESLIIDEALTFLFAGHDTTSSLLSWAMTFLCRDENRGVVEKLRNEANAVFGDRIPTFDDVKNLKYSTLVAKETLRMRPPVPLLDRRAVDDYSYEGEHIAANTYVYPILIAAHYDNRYWNDPFSFNPDRFESSADNRCAFSFVPFSALSRNCIGQKFAMMEAVLALSMIIQKFDVIGKTDEEAISWEFEGTLKPTNFECYFKPVNC